MLFAILPICNVENDYRVISNRDKNFDFTIKIIDKIRIKAIYKEQSIDTFIFLDLIVLVYL